MELGLGQLVNFGHTYFDTKFGNTHNIVDLSKLPLPSEKHE
jgi:hypothetical protein